MDRPGAQPDRCQPQLSSQHPLQPCHAKSCRVVIIVVKIMVDIIVNIIVIVIANVIIMSMVEWKGEADMPIGVVDAYMCMCAAQSSAHDGTLASLNPAYGLCTVELHDRT